MKGNRFLGSGAAAVLVVLLMSGLALAQAPASTPLGTAFTYQGQLKQSDVPYNGTCDVKFALFDALTGGTQVGILTKSNIAVNGGLFTVQLDYGTGKFAGDARWLEMSVRCPAGSGSYTLLSPRQAMTAAPYALYSKAAPWSGLSGIPAGFADGTDNDTTYSAGTGLTLSGTTFSANTTYLQRRVSGSCTTGNAIRVIAADGTVTCQAVSGGGWSLTGNAGTTPGTNYLGTSDNVALEIKVNAARVLRFEPNASGPNLVGGYSGNWLTSGVSAATIAGGGFSGAPNRVTDNSGTVGGGYSNQAGDSTGTVADAAKATVGGGDGNTASGAESTVGGGHGNTASGFAAAVGGGELNGAGGNMSSIGGGYGNVASANLATVGGGSGNDSGGHAATIGGGLGNEANGEYSTVPGGNSNTASGDKSFAAGYRAKATSAGSFVWADSQDGEYGDNGVNTFNVRAQKGAYIWANSATTRGAYVYNAASGANAGQGTAVLGRTDSDYGYGVAGYSYHAGVGVGAWSYSGDLIRAYDGDFPAGVLRFYVDQAGNVHYDGSLMPYVALPSPTRGQPEHVSLYGLASTEVWFEDLGSASLVEGRVQVPIDPIFAQTVALTETYQVYLTATCQEPVLLFVSEKTVTHFTVQGVNLSGQPSSCGFDYRLAAKRLGYEDLRLRAVEIPAPVAVDRESQP